MSADAARPSVLCANAAGQGDAAQQRQRQQPQQQHHQEAAGTSVVMPFVMRKVEPRHLCRGHVPAGSQGWPVGAELEAVANGALTSSLKQLASLLTAAEDIFASLTVELASVTDRSGHLRRRIDKVEERLSAVDPKKIPVREYRPSIRGLSRRVNGPGFSAGGRDLIGAPVRLPFRAVACSFVSAIVRRRGAKFRREQVQGPPINSANFPRRAGGKRDTEEMRLLTRNNSINNISTVISIASLLFRTLSCD